jgi:hypothetical protein
MESDKFDLVKGKLIMIEERTKANKEIFFKYHIETGGKTIFVSRFKDQGTPTDEERTWEKENEIVEIKTVSSGVFINFFDKEAIRKVDQLEDMQKTLEAEKEAEIVPNETKKEEIKSAQLVNTLPKTIEQKTIVPQAMRFPGMIADVERAKKEWANYIELTNAIIDESDYQTVGSGPNQKKFKKKSAWRKYARFFDITDEIIKQDIIRNKEGKIIEVITVVLAHAPNGRTTPGVGACSIDERKFAHQNHDILATSHTRAKSRAISDLIGSGEVSAEEVDGSE